MHPNSYLHAELIRSHRQELMDEAKMMRLAHEATKGQPGLMRQLLAMFHKRHPAPEPAGNLQAHPAMQSPPE